jgi:hypothetical protein
MVGAAGSVPWPLAESNGRKWPSRDLAPTAKWPYLQRRPIAPPEPRVIYTAALFSLYCPSYCLSSPGARFLAGGGCLFARLRGVPFESNRVIYSV